MTLFVLVDPCKYSFKDLYVAATVKSDQVDQTNQTDQTDQTNQTDQTDQVEKWYRSLLTMDQPEINRTVKTLCTQAGWYWVDMVEDDVVYTSFSPQINKAQSVAQI